MCVELLKQFFFLFFFFIVPAGQFKSLRSPNCPSCLAHLHSKRAARGGEWAFVLVAMSKSQFYSAAMSQWPSCDKCSLMDETDGV